MMENVFCIIGIGLYQCEISRNTKKVKRNETVILDLFRRLLQSYFPKPFPLIPCLPTFLPPITDRAPPPLLFLSPTDSLRVWDSLIPILSLSLPPHQLIRTLISSHTLATNNLLILLSFTDL